MENCALNLYRSVELASSDLEVQVCPVILMKKQSNSKLIYYNGL